MPTTTIELGAPAPHPVWMDVTVTALASTPNSLAAPLARTDSSVPLVRLIASLNCKQTPNFTTACGVGRDVGRVVDPPVLVDPLVPVDVVDDPPVVVEPLVTGVGDWIDTSGAFVTCTDTVAPTAAATIEENVPLELSRSAVIWL